MKKRQKEILEAINSLGGEATVRQIAGKLGLSVNGVSQSLGALYKYVLWSGGKGGEAKYKLNHEGGLFAAE